MIANVGGSLDRAIADARRMQTLPNERVAATLDKVLGAAFFDAQEKVHVVSGALKASGRSGSNLRPGDSWLGRMAWGGEPGTEHAVYEMAEGGEHDWLRDSHAYEEAFEEAIERSISAELDR